MKEAPENSPDFETSAIKACIFDLDGVVVDTAHYHFLAWRRLAGELGFELTIGQNERLKGVSRMRSLEIILELAGIDLPPDEKEKMADKKNGWFVGYLDRMKPDEIFPGVRELIHDLKSRGIKVALASSSKNAMKVIRLLGIQDEFDAAVDGSMITHSKPHPEIFLLAASRLGVVPKYCLVFEDAEAGVEAAHAAGMKCIGVGSAAQLGGAERVIEKTGDFRISTLRELEIV